MRAARPAPARRGEALAAWLFLLPSLLGVTVYVLAPFAEMLRRSFCDARGQTPVGLLNYRAVLENSAFRLAVQNTLRFLCVCLPLLLALSLLLAFLLEARCFCKSRAARVFRTSFLLPMAIPVASIVLLWQVLFAQNGLADRFLTALGAAPVDFMGTDAAFWVLVGTYLWKNCGYDCILWAAGLKNIPSQLYEAAAVDGANWRQSFCAVTLPELFSTAVPVAVLSLLNTFKVFREAYLVAGPYPQKSIYLLQHLFNNWFLALDLPRLSAAAALTAACVLLCLLPLLRSRDRHF